MVVVGHEAECDYGRVVWLSVAVNEVQAVFIVGRVEKYQPFSHSPIIDVVIVVAGEYVDSIGHRLTPFLSSCD